MTSIDWTSVAAAYSSTAGTDAYAALLAKYGPIAHLWLTMGRGSSEDQSIIWGLGSTWEVQTFGRNRDYTPMQFGDVYTFDYIDAGMAAGRANDDWNTTYFFLGASVMFVGPTDSPGGGGRIGTKLSVSPKIPLQPAVAEGTALARRLGAEGERLAGIDAAAKVRIPSSTGTAAYRIPDALADAGLTEVKNVTNLGYTNQLRDYVAYASSTGRTLDLIVRKDTVLTRELQDLIDAGRINLIRSLPTR